MIQLNIDCEGPITQNDNAFELCEELIPQGGDFFARVSKYDDYLADVEKRPGYKAGDTLKLVLPFLKAFGATNKYMEEFSERTLVLLPGAQKMLPKVAEMMPTYIISTSYAPYLDALCKHTGFPKKQVYCTDVDIDRYSLSDRERELLEKFLNEIIKMDLLSWPDGANDSSDLTPGNREILARLNQIFWGEISNMAIGRLFDDVNPIGGVEKARAVENSLEETSNYLSDVFYVGDSITDVQALELVRKSGGVALSFNGNSYAVKAAQFACISGSTLIIATLAELLMKNSSLLEEILLKNDGRLEGGDLLQKLHEINADLPFLDELGSLGSDDMPRLFLVEKADLPQLIEESEFMRKNVRGVSVGNLG